MPPAECARLRAVPDTLSQWDGMKGFKLKDFRAAPHLQRWEKVPIVKRALRALLVAGLEPDECEDFGGMKGGGKGGAGGMTGVIGF